MGIDVVIENGVTCGPRCYLRPGTHLLDGAHVGTHVEIKKSTIGEGSKVPHLSYIGDTTMGSGVNVGAGSITCNYDGKNKHATVIGNRVFIGSDTMMVAPVSIGDDAITGASSCITHDVPAAAPAAASRTMFPPEPWASSAASSASSRATPSFVAPACNPFGRVIWDGCKSHILLMGLPVVRFWTAGFSMPMPHDV